MYKKKVIHLLVLLGTVFFICSNDIVSAQNPDNKWIYVLSSTDAEYELIRISSTTFSAELVYSFSKTPKEKFSDIIPDSELEAAKAFLRTKLADDSTVANSLRKTTPKVSVTILSVSPDNQHIAMKVIYERCIEFDFAACFGVSQIVVVSTANKTSRVAWILNHHAIEYAPKDCIKTPWLYVRIRDLRWTPNNENLVIRFTGSVSCFESGISPLIIIPIKTGSTPLNVGEVLYWDFADLPNRIVSITGKLNVALDEFDIPSKRNIHQEQSLKDPVVFYDHYSNIAYLNNHILVSGEYLMDDRQRLVVINPATGQVNFSEFDAGIIRGSVNGQTAIIATTNNSLYVASLAENQVNVRSLLSNVTFWRQHVGGDLLVQQQGSNLFSIVDIQGKVQTTIDIPQSLINLQNQLGKSIYQPDAGQLDIVW